MSKVFPITYQIKGVVLDAQDLSKINEYYEAASTAEYIFENYRVTEIKALELGYAVRERMNKYCESEDEAINIVMREKNI